MFYDAPLVEDQPRVVVQSWRTYVIGDDVHLVCIMPETGRVRTTTPIQTSDLDKQEFVTESGRLYECVGPMSPDGVEFRMALLLNGLISSLDDFVADIPVLQ